MNPIRKEDIRRSEIVSLFLDRNFYNNSENFHRIFSKKEQFQGIDTKFSFNGIEYICDEKAATDYVNKNLRTFSMELSFIDRSNSIHDGWLIDSEKINNSFMFIWVDKAKNNQINNIDDIECLEMTLVKKENILSYLSSIGWTVDKLIRKSNKMRNDAIQYSGNINLNGCKFVYSINNKIEKPINVLISRDKLKEISDYNKIWNLQ